MRTFAGCIVVTALFLSSALPVLAQSGFTPDLTLTLNPEFPKPGERVSATVGGYSLDLASASITWRVNGNVVSQGAGIKTVSFTLPPGGGAVTVDVTAVAQSGLSGHQSVRVVPSTVDIIWESDTYTPPFYRGKSIYTIGSAVSLVAFAEFPSASGFALANPKSTVYTWKVDNIVQGSLSGAGKQRLFITLQNIDKPTLIEVNVHSLDGSQVGYGQTVINPGSPLVVLYEENPVLGTRYDTALPNVTRMTGDEITVNAVPYFFQAKTRSSANLQYQWGVNSQATDNQATVPYLITLRRNAADTGYSILSLAVSHATKLLQTAAASIQIQYGSE